VGAEPSQYFSGRPTVGSQPKRVELVLPDLTVGLRTDRGVFAVHRVDAGTLVLLREVGAPPPGTVVDLGCGYGPIAVTLARRRPDAHVWAVDVNERARRLCEANAADAGCTNVTVVGPEGFPPDLAVDALYSNPPVRIGKTALQELLTRWLRRLAPDGVAWLVVHKHLGSDSLARWLNDAGWRARRRTSRQGYRVLEVTRGPGPS